MPFHVEVLALPVLGAVSAILCAACLVPAQIAVGAGSCFGFRSGRGV